MKHQSPESLSDSSHSGQATLEKLPNVSHETLHKLEIYARLLADWNQKFNLVSASTLPQIWSRHFLDSAQLASHIDPARQPIADLGSGAGFPGLVLSIMGIPKIRLIESTGKKAGFLSHVITELGLDAVVINERAEALDLHFKTIVARALAPLPELLDLTKRILNRDGMLVLLKGENIDAELTLAAKYWTFQATKTPSISNPSGSVLVVKDIRRNDDTPHKHRSKSAAKRH